MICSVDFNGIDFFNSVKTLVKESTSTMESPENTDTSPALNKITIGILGTDLPTDEEIEETLLQREETINNKDQDELERDSETDGEEISDCDSDFDGMEKLWDTLINSNEPYGNTVEHLNKILKALPKRLSTRARKETDRFDQRFHAKKQLEKIDKILNSNLVDPDIDEEILMENLERMRANIRNIIRKKERASEN